MNMYAQIFLFQCSNCHKQRELTVRDGYIGTKGVETIDCVCGKMINITQLKYLMRIRFNFKDQNYFVK